ncbi:1-deoxy-D-xylulose-5-phosphate reductoisomerase [Sphingomonas ginsenosidivorax]|uniref:1-deoxy-D-xylulose 5-phosphate reductoisomerase n=1 Tax=Sphingomonas ginsenosidivorax TaxID=862135 RepID=A0A5C6U8Q5_9SPHN|nr:1-deoxy-D-xylulose-5-phosphate reductoisomerase [Sphingomonas ginsenosidivorax]TXC68005.1 1-deoxy-D-xylulose-5-phosphate reductoisomerase [Sphingomonas ginsenosidivorax]
MTLNRRSVTVLGATGSIGNSTLDLINRHPDTFDVDTVTAHRDIVGLAAAARQSNARYAVIADETKYLALKGLLGGTGIQVAAGADAIIERAGAGTDWTMAAIVGLAGLEPIMAALRAGGTVALANKEALVAAGTIMMDAVVDHGATLLPVDSEHNAVFQCFEPDPARIRRIVLTASGGPFRTWSYEQMRYATVTQAVKHPNWPMGHKISVDSATMMNKGLELIEARHLFGVAPGMLDIVVHPESIIHSMVDFIDGSTLAQMGCPDMRVPIAYTLAWPERMATPCDRLDLAQLGQLTFEKPDEDRFPALRIAKSALYQGGATPVIMNAANEVAVAAFLQQHIGFADIMKVVEMVLETYMAPDPADLDDVHAIDEEARAFTTFHLKAAVAA